MPAHRDRAINAHEPSQCIDCEIFNLRNARVIVEHDRRLTTARIEGQQGIEYAVLAPGTLDSLRGVAE